MTMHCDYCRQTLGRSVVRYWHMRFCSTACGRAYEDRLQDATKVKISCIDVGRSGPDTGRHLVPRSPGGFGAPLAG